VDSGLKMQNITKREVVSNVLGHKKYGDVAYDAKADLQKMLDAKVDDLVITYPGIKDGNRSVKDVQSLTQQMQKYAGGESYKEAFAVWDQINAQQPALEASIAAINEQLNAASGGVKKALERKRAAYQNALAEVRWWASQPRTHKSGGSAALYNRIPTRNAYKG